MKRVNAFLIVTALLLIALGVVCIFYPIEIFHSMAWLAGLLILFTGIVSLLFGLKAQRFLPNAGSTTLLAVFQIIVGLMMISNNIISSIAIVVVFALWVMFEGISLSVLSFDYKRSGYDHWWLMLIFGLCSLLLGFVAMRNPEAVEAFMGILLGLGILANGVERIVAFCGLKRIQKMERDLKESAEAYNIDNEQ